MLVKALRIDEDVGSRKSSEIRRRGRRRWNLQSIRDLVRIYNISEGRVSNNDDVCAAGALSRWRSSKDKIRMRLLNWLPKNMCIICCSMRSTPDAFDGLGGRSFCYVNAANDFDFFSSSRMQPIGYDRNEREDWLPVLCGQSFVCEFLTNYRETSSALSWNFLGSPPTRNFSNGPH